MPRRPRIARHGAPVRPAAPAPGSPRSSGLRASLGEPAEAAAGVGDPSKLRPSRGARKRQALALQELGVRLTALKPAQLEQLELPEPLLTAVLEAQQLRSRAALARQRQYIGRLMRALDPAPIEQALATCGRSPQRQC